MSKQPKSRVKKAAPKTKGKGRAKPKKMEQPKKAEKTPKVAKKAVKAEKTVKTGAAPTPIVSVTHGLTGKTRRARGFSLSELRTVGLDLPKGRRLGLRIDPRRGTELGKNVEALKKWVAPSAETPKSRGKPEKAKTKSASKTRAGKK